RCELLNTHGVASHRKEESRPKMVSIQALLSAQTTDAIVGFFHQLHLQDRAQADGTKLAYRDNAEFNEYVDEANEPVRIFDLKYQPSDVLFNVDLEAYRTLLNEFDVQDSDSQSSPQGDVPGGSV